MDKPDFYKILCTSSPEEINDFISSKGKKKMVNAITFITNNESTSDYTQNSSNSNSGQNN